jgi:hypothetical protein
LLFPFLATLPCMNMHAGFFASCCFSGTSILLLCARVSIFRFFPSGISILRIDVHRIRGKSLVDFCRFLQFMLLDHLSTLYAYQLHHFAFGDGWFLPFSWPNTMHVPHCTFSHACPSHMCMPYSIVKSELLFTCIKASLIAKLFFEIRGNIAKSH